MNLHMMNLPQPPQPTRVRRILRALANPFGWPLGEPPVRGGELFVLPGRPGYRSGGEADRNIADPWLTPGKRGSR